jgi:hypothetical protein
VNHHADEYLCWITDLAENGSTEVDKTGETERRMLNSSSLGLSKEVVIDFQCNDQ